MAEEEEKKEVIETEETELESNQPNADETPLQDNGDGEISNKELMDLIIQLRQQVIAIQDVLDTANPIEANAEQTEEETPSEETPSEEGSPSENKYDDAEELAKVDALLNEK